MPNYRVVKNRKRLWIVDEYDEQIYTPPSFLTLPNREGLQEVADYWTEFGYDIKTIIDFESKWQRKRR